MACGEVEIGSGIVMPRPPGGEVLESMTAQARWTFDVYSFIIFMKFI